MVNKMSVFIRTYIHTTTTTSPHSTPPLLLFSFLFFPPFSSPPPPLHYSPKQTVPSLMYLSQSAQFFGLSVQFVILPLLMFVCTLFHHLFFGHPLNRPPRGLLLNTWLNFLLLSILLIWPIQFNQLVLTNESLSKFPDSCINSLLSLSPILFCFYSPKHSS